MKRRHFLKTSTLGIMGAGLVSTSPVFPEDAKTPEKTPEPKTQPVKIKEYRTLGRTGFKVSDISAGAPSNEGILAALLDAGVNYIDTAESYGKGQSEKTVGNVIKNRDRKKLFITSKLVMKKDDTKETIVKRTNECLERLQTTYIDCMMMHSAAKVETVQFEPFHEAMKQLKSEGKIKFVGLSNHGSQWTTESLEKMEDVCLAAVADGRFDVLLFVYNFLQEEAGKKILKACKDKNIGVTLMKVNPVGTYYEMAERVEKMKSEGKEIPKNLADTVARLASQLELAKDFIQKHNLKNPVEIRDAAIRYTLSHPQVHTVCCSIDNFEGIDSYLSLSGTTLSNTDQKKLSLFKEGCSTLYCRHACGICESHCPEHVPVNTIMRYNHYFDAQGRQKHAMQKYAALSTPKADKCWNCSGHCQNACPYGVPIHALLNMAHQQLCV
ncbi:MAG: aldo/keto reductase [Candidatus Omnitrophota bacterium]